MEVSVGTVLRQARELRGLSAMETARRARISSAYLSKLENDSVKRPSPEVLYRLGGVLGVPYADLLALVGHPLPGVGASYDRGRLSDALLADLTDEERGELIEYLAWYRARKRPIRRAES
jgi:transcriptional regulator with XRE-family HTH domain